MEPDAVSGMEPNTLGWSLIAVAILLVCVTLVARRRGSWPLARLGSAAVIAMLVGLTGLVLFAVVNPGFGD